VQNTSGIVTESRESTQRVQNSPLLMSVLLNFCLVLYYLIRLKVVP
jgi:hypothetical protein